MRAILLHLVPASLYAALGIHFWRTRWLSRERPARSPQLGRAERSWLAVALLAHGLLLHALLFGSGAMQFGFSIALSLMIWLAVAFYWVENFYARLDGLQALAMPAATFATLIPLLFPPQHLLTHTTTPGFRVHFVLAMLAYSVFTLAALHALLMAFAERALHGARLNRLFASLPPLLTMERLLFRLIAIAFALLTLTLATGAMFSETLFGQAVTVNHKTVFAFVSWLLFGVLLLGRHLRGWRGRLALRWTLIGFVALLLAYVGSRFVLEVLLLRAP